ncbi:hypothetical protein ACW73L_20620, partial [Methylolobus aquaticus]
MALYCGIDLHSNNHVVVVIDEEDRRILERRFRNDVTLTLQTLVPYRSELAGDGRADRHASAQASGFRGGPAGRRPAAVG